MKRPLHSTSSWLALPPHAVNHRLDSSIGKH
uniref:Uncharacterized protein n=1 Tax=Anguilla anguilla TaxID=7936 RepID=A0A0E9SG49_ANGAN